MCKSFRYLVWGLVFVAIAVAALVIWCRHHDGVVVCVTNSSQQELKAAEIVVSGDGITHHLVIPSFLPAQVRCLELPAPSSGDASFSFEDDAGIIHDAVVLGYFERGYSGRSIVNVGSDMKLTVHEEISPDCLSRGLRLF
jgi:hypothetical protein